MKAFKGLKNNVSKGFGNVTKGIGNLVKKNLAVDTKSPAALTDVTCLILEIFWEEDQRVKNEIEGKFQTDFSKFIDPLTEVEVMKDEDEKRKFNSLHRANHNFVYYLLNTELDELHETYSQFFEEFDDSEKSGLMEQKEFIAMLNLLCKPEYIGKNKLSKCFERLCASCVANSKHIDKLFEGTSTEQLGPNLMNDLFRKFQTEILEIDEKDKPVKKEVVEYIQFFPFIMSFFSEWIARKIETRKEQILMIRGIAEDEVMEIAKTSSLLSKIKSLGFEYNKDEPTEINYREIEKALILFRNAYSGKLKTEQLTLILDEVKKKYQYDPRTGTFGKIIKLNLKLLTFIAYRICLHSFCSHIYETNKDAKAQEYIEEYSAWAGAVNAKKLSEEYLRRKFLRIVHKKVEDLEGLFETDKLKKLFKFFIKRIIPQMPPKDVDNVVTIYSTSQGSLAMHSLPHFAANIYNLLLYYAKIKLGHYISCVHYSITEREKKSKDRGHPPGPLELQEGDEICRTRLKEHPCPGDEVMEVNDRMRMKEAAVYKHTPKRKTRKLGTNFVSRSPVKKTTVADGLLFGVAGRKPRTTTFKYDEKELGKRLEAAERAEKTQAEKQPESMTEDQMESRRNMDASISAMLQRRTALVNEYRNSFVTQPSGMQGRLTTGASITDFKTINNDSLNTNKDVLNSFFIMETFIEKYLFHRKTTGDNKIADGIVKNDDDEADKEQEKNTNDLKIVHNVNQSPSMTLQKKIFKKQIMTLAEKLAKNPKLGEVEEMNEKHILEDDDVRNDLLKDNNFDPSELKVVRKVNNSKRKGVCDECNIF
jgi:hypothetical protein